jgi:hypothetical protein
MTMTKSKAITEGEHEPSVYFDFPNDKKNVPKDFDALEVDGEITVVIKGKVQSIRHDLDSRAFGMTFSKVKLTIPKSGPTSMADRATTGGA